MLTSTLQNKTQKRIIFLSQMRPGSYQHRAAFNRDDLENLAKTIREHGVLNPPIVYQDGEDYPLIAGERRWRTLCAIHLYDQGAMSWPQALDMISAEDARQRLLGYRSYLTAIELEVKVAPEYSNHRVLSIIENGQRQNLTPLEEARDYRGLLEDGYTPAEVADLAGKSEKTITTTVALLDLEPEVQELLNTGVLDKTHGIHLSTVKERDAQIGLAQRAVKSGWKAATTEAACRAYHRPARKKKAAPQPTGMPASPQPDAIPIGDVTFVPVYRPRQQHHLSLDSTDYILALSEECCGSCLKKGLSPQCLSCEGFLEFANQLLREVNYEPRS